MRKQSKMVEKRTPWGVKAMDNGKGSPLTSKKLIGSIAAMISIAGTIVGSIALGIEEAATATVSVAGVTAPVIFWAIFLCASLGGVQIIQQAWIDKNGTK